MEEDPELLSVLESVHEKKGLDFTLYKPGTLKRRIDARLRRHGLKNYKEYLKLLEKDTAEFDKLLDSLAINVTEFFRNPEMFKVLSDVVVPNIIETKNERKHRIIRAWSAGCSSGDEPYSVAMVILDELGKERPGFIVTIMGTDIDSGAIKEAKNMVYSRDRLKGLTDGTIKKYFRTAGENEYKIAPEVARLVRFMKHDVVNDRPIMRCDLILMRNLLIYFNRELQEEVQLKLYECLNPGGFLVLGMMESLTGSAIKRFECVDNVHRIYRRPVESPVSADDRIMSQNEIDSVVGEILGTDIDR